MLKSSEPTGWGADSLKGKGDAEGCAASEAGGLGPDAAAVLADGVAGDGEAETGTGAAAGGVGLVEAFEDAVEFVEGEAGACCRRR